MLVMNEGGMFAALGFCAALAFVGYNYTQSMNDAEMAKAGLVQCATQGASGSVLVIWKKECE